MESVRQSVKSPEQNIGAILGIDRQGNIWIDPVRKITYISAFLPTFLAYALAHGAEVPREASLDKGIQILKGATLDEGYETAATFVVLPDGETFWYSTEGVRGSVDPHKDFGDDPYGKKYGFIKQIIREHSINGGEVEINEYHNHPIQSYLPGWDGKVFSVPPSGFGFTQEGGDTSFVRHGFLQEAIKNIESESGISISFNYHVVDALGVWEYKFVGLEDINDEQIYRATQKLNELFLASENGQVPLEESANKAFWDEYMIHLKVVEGAKDRLDELRSRWVDTTESGNFDETLYKSLVSAYRDVGVEVSYEAFKK